MLSDFFIKNIVNVDSVIIIQNIFYEKNEILIA